MSFKTAEELEGLIETFIAEKTAAEKPLTVAGLAVYLDVSRETLNKYKSGDYDTEDCQYSDAIKKAVSYIEADKIENALLGKYNATVAIFDLKNNHGYRDKSEQEISGPNSGPIETVTKIELVPLRGNSTD